MENQPFPEKITTERLILRRHSEAKTEIIFSYVERDRERLRLFLPWVDLTKTIEDERSYILMAIEKWNSRELFDYGIYLKENDLYLGNAGVHTLDWEHERCEIGYWILGSFEGQGYISEAVRGIEAAAFNVGFNRIEIRCSSLNLRSARVPRRLNYHLDGTLRQDSIEHKQFRDTFVFSKLRNESNVTLSAPEQSN